jgi:hypothetical protein
MSDNVVLNVSTNITCAVVIFILALGKLFTANVTIMVVGVIYTRSESESTIITGVTALRRLMNAHTLVTYITCVVLICIYASGNELTTVTAVVIALCLNVLAYLATADVALMVGGSVCTLGESLATGVALVVVGCVCALADSFAAVVAGVVAVSVCTLVSHEGLNQIAGCEAKCYTNTKRDDRDD